jgi:hypothetical protein
MIRMRQPGPVLVVLLAMMMATRSIIPAGWMPSVSADGIEIIMCSSQVAMPAQMEHHSAQMDHMDHHDGAEMSGEEEHTSPPCPYGTLSLGSELPPTATLAVFPIIAPAAYADEREAFVLRAQRATRPPARGPPILA